MKPIKVLLADDHKLFRQGVRKAIEQEEDIEVVGEAQDGIVALAKARELRPDLILMDIDMPHSNGLEAISVIKRELPEIKVIMLTVFDQDEYLYEAIKRGAEGLLDKNVRAGDILDSVRMVIKGQIVLAGYVNERVFDEWQRRKQSMASKTAATERQQDKV